MKTSEELLSPQVECSIIRSSLPVLDPTWETVTTLFPGQTGMKILLSILASARIIQRALPNDGLVDEAVLDCSTLTAFAKQAGYGKDTLLRYIKLYQALGLLTSTRVWKKQRSVTELHLPLAPYHPSLEALERVEALTYGGRKKQQDLARSIRDRYILIYDLSPRKRQETEVGADPLYGLLSRVSCLLQKKRINRVERQVLVREISAVLVQLGKQQRGDPPSGVNTSSVSWQQTQRGDPLPLCGDQEALHENQTTGEAPGRGDLPHEEGDPFHSSMIQPEERSYEEGDLMRKKGDLPLACLAQRGDLACKKGDLPTATMLQSEDPAFCKGDFAAQNSDDTPEMGDLNVMDDAPSSIDSLPTKDSSQKEFELESQTGEQWTGSEQELSQEAITYLTLLDGPEYATPDYLSTHAGKKALPGYKNKIRRDPRLARVAAINTLLQRTFYDLTRQKKPLEHAGKWFHSSFDRYADQMRPMEITGEILDWAKSPYTLQEIASVLPRERKRQETQWWSPESAHLPFSSCVVSYHYLRDDASEIRRSVSERERDGFPLETARQDTGGSGGLLLPQWMSCAEAEQLADEMSHEASWYLDGIQVHPEPQLAEHAYVVEACIAETTFSMVYASRQEWWQDHQQQRRHQTWKEQQKEKKRKTHFSSGADSKNVSMGTDADAAFVHTRSLSVDDALIAQ